MLEQCLEGRGFLLRIRYHCGLAERNDGAVIHRVRKCRLRQHQSVEKSHANTNRPALFETREPAARNCTVQKKFVAEARVGHWNNHHTITGVEPDVCDQAFIQDNE